MRNTHPALFSANENRNRPKARTNVTNFRANATLPDKKSQGPLRMPGPFFVLYTDKVPIYGQNQPPKQDKTSETRRTSPALNRNRPPTPPALRHRKFPPSRKFSGMEFAVSESRPFSASARLRTITPAWGPARHTDAQQRGF